QRAIQRRRVAAGARVKPVTLQHTVVERRVGVLVRGVGGVKRTVRGGTVVLIAVCLEQRAVLTVGQGRFVAASQRDRRGFHVGGRQRGVAVVRHAVEPAGKRE